MDYKPYLYYHYQCWRAAYDKSVIDGIRRLEIMRKQYPTALTLGILALAIGFLVLMERMR